MTNDVKKVINGKITPYVNNHKICLQFFFKSFENFSTHIYYFSFTIFVSGSNHFDYLTSLLFVGPILFQWILDF